MKQPPLVVAAVDLLLRPLPLPRKWPSVPMERQDAAAHGALDSGGCFKAPSADTDAVCSGSVAAGDELATVMISTVDIYERLKIRKLLGAGAYAMVYRATLDGRSVALKVLLPQHANSPNQGREDSPVSMFLSEWGRHATMRAVPAWVAARMTATTLGRTQLIMNHHLWPCHAAPAACRRLLTSSPATHACPCPSPTDRRRPLHAGTKACVSTPLTLPKRVPGGGVAALSPARTTRPV